MLAHVDLEGVPLLLVAHAIHHESAATWACAVGYFASAWGKGREKRVPKTCICVILDSP